MVISLVDVKEGRVRSGQVSTVSRSGDETGQIIWKRKEENSQHLVLRQATITVRQGRGRGHGILSKYHQGNRKERPIAVCCIQDSLSFSLTRLSNAEPSGVMRSRRGKERAGKNTSTNIHHQAAATKDNLPFGGPKCRVPSEEIDRIPFVSFPVSTLLFLLPALASDEAC